MVKNNQNFVLKNIFITKISKTFDFFGQKSKKKKLSFFLGAFIWNHPMVNLPKTIVDLPNTMVDLLKTVMDLPSFLTEFTALLTDQTKPKVRGFKGIALNQV